MSPLLSRRTCLAGTSVALLSLSGCLSGTGTEGQTETTETKRCQVATSSLSASPVDPTTRQQTAIVPVEFVDQPKRLREIFAAVADGETITGACPTGTPTTRRERLLPEALDVVQNALYEQQEQYDGDPPEWIDRTAYLHRSGEFYAFSAMLSDVAVSYPADLPSASSPSTVSRTQRP